MAVSEEPVTWPPTPPCSSDPPIKDVSSVVTAIHVISTERAALAHLEHIYQTDERAQHDLARAVDQIARSVREGSKLVVCGVGKSGKVGRKIEATMNSLGVYSAFLHPTEALHGDLGLIRPVSRLQNAFWLSFFWLWLWRNLPTYLDLSDRRMIPFF
jgi:hypothetical protein